LTYSFEEESFFSNSTKLAFGGFDGNLSFTETYTFDILNDAPSESITSLKLWWFTAQLRAAESIGYTFDPGIGWQAGVDKEFMITQAVAGFDYVLDERRFWKNRISLSGFVNSSWTLSWVRATDSSMDFGFGIDLSIAEFLELSISSRSVNKASYRYIPSIAESLDLDWTNPATDIMRSFNFFNLQDRVDSYFNLETVSVSLVHMMPDWDLTVEYTGNPDLVEGEGASKYEWTGEVSVFVQWKPIPEIKRTVTSKDGEITL
jgi:hypothetical protein